MTALFTGIALFILTGLHLWEIYTRTGADLIAPNGMPVGTDFIAFWSAAQLALSGQPASAYDLTAIGAIEKALVPGADALTPWLYPPTFLMVVKPLGLLPYVTAWLVFVISTLLAMLYLLYRLRPHWSTPVLALAYPAIWLNFLSGQNAFLSVCLLVLALVHLHSRPILAGSWIGLLSYKPQLGLLWPVALAAGGHWRSFFSASLAVILFAALSAALLGPSSWQAFWHSLNQPVDFLEQQRLPLERMVSAFSMVRDAGWAAWQAWLAQALLTMIAAVCVMALWRSPALSLNVKGASLAVGILMATPHVFQYDLVILVLALTLWLREAEQTRWLGGERPLLYFCWISPILLMPLRYDHGIAVYPLLYLVMQLMLLRRVRLIHNS
jgi:hypothetical protein